MNLTFHEKSLWASLISTILIFGFYFSQAYMVLSDPLISENKLGGLLIGVTILIILTQIILQASLAIFDYKDAGRKSDERERLIDLKAGRIAHYILVLGVWITILSIYFQPSSITLINILLFFFIVSELVGYVIQLHQFRKGV